MHKTKATKIIFLCFYEKRQKIKKFLKVLRIEFSYGKIYNMQQCRILNYIEPGFLGTSIDIPHVEDHKKIWPSLKGLTKDV